MVILANVMIPTVAEHVVIMALLALPVIVGAFRAWLRLKA